MSKGCCSAVAGKATGKERLSALPGCNSLSPSFNQQHRHLKKIYEYILTKARKKCSKRNEQRLLYGGGGVKKRGKRGNGSPFRSPLFPQSMHVYKIYAYIPLKARKK
jgi:hypothetical protein